MKLKRISFFNIKILPNITSHIFNNYILTKSRFSKNFLTVNRALFSTISNKKNIIDNLKDEKLEKPKLFKITLTGLEPLTTTDEIKKVLSLVDEIEILNVDKKNKKNYCHANIKSLLNEEILKERMNKFKITSKTIKVRIKELDSWIDNIDKKNLEPIVSELKKISEIKDFINKEINKKQISFKPNNIRYLNNFTEYFDKIAKNNPMKLMNIDEMIEREFSIKFIPNYLELELIINHLNERDLMKSQFKDLKYSDLQEKNYYINEIKSFSNLEKGLRNDKMSNELKSFLNLVLKVKEESKKSLEELIKNLKFPPFYDNNQLAWKGMKLQIINDNDQNILNICISIDVNYLSLLDISIIKKAIYFKFKNVINIDKIKTNFFLCISKGVNSQINESSKFIYLDDVEDYEILDKNIKNNVDNNKSEHEISKNFLKRKGKKLSYSYKSDISPYNSLDTVINHIQNIDLSKYGSFKNCFHYIGKLLQVGSNNNLILNKSSKSKVKVDYINEVESRFIEHADILENFDSKKIIEKLVFSNKPETKRSNYQEKLDKTENIDILNLNSKDLDEQESLLIVNISELNKNKDHQISLKKIMQTIKIQILYSNSIKELIDFCKFYSNRNIDFEILDFHLLDNVYINFNSFILVIGLDLDSNKNDLKNEEVNNQEGSKI